jgi:hypothetical protein
MHAAKEGGSTVLFFVEDAILDAARQAKEERDREKD